MASTTRGASAPVDAASTTMGSGLVAAAIAVTVWGASGVVAKWIPMGAAAIVAYRFSIYALVIGTIGVLRGQRLTWQALRTSAPAGILLGADVVLFFSAVKLTSVVNATIIGSLQPILLTAYGVRFLGERVERRDAMLGAVALAGVIVIVLAGSNSGEASIWGDLCAVGALLMWSAYFIAAKRVSGSTVSPSDFTLSAAIVVALMNVPLAVIAGQSLGWPGWENLLAVAGLAMVAGIFGHNLMNWAIPRIPLWLSSTFTLLVPVVSSAVAWAWLGESLNAVQIVAMSITVLALGVLIWFQQTAKDDAPATPAEVAST